MYRLIIGVFSMIALLFLTSALGSCKKGKSTINLKGNIFNGSSNQWMASMNLTLSEVNAVTGLPNEIQSTSTDANGQYSFSFPRNQVDHYILTGTKENCFQLEVKIPFSELSIKKDNYYNAIAYEKGWVKLRFENFDPQPGEILSCNINKTKTGCEECCSTGLFTISNDTSIFCINDGNHEFEYYYNNTTTGQSGFKSAITTSFDTTEIYLLY